MFADCRRRRRRRRGRQRQRQEDKRIFCNHIVLFIKENKWTPAHLSLSLSLKSYKLTIEGQNIFQQEQTSDWCNNYSETMVNFGHQKWVEEKEEEEEEILQCWKKKKRVYNEEGNLLLLKSWI